MKVVIDGIRYYPESEVDKEVQKILSTVYGKLWTEAYYDAYNEDTRRFAAPLADLMMEANKTLHFKE